MRKLLAYIPIVSVVSGSVLFAVYVLIEIISHMSNMDLIINAGVLVFGCWLVWGLGEINRDWKP